jgi:ankyrin repeat protein
MNDWYEREQFHFAADEGDLPKVRRLVEMGIKVNVFDDLSHIPLHYAAKKEDIEVVRYLLSVGADENAREEEKIGNTPLREIAAICPYEIAKLLVDAGANPTIPGWMQLTSLDHAKERKNQKENECTNYCNR